MRLAFGGTAGVYAAFHERHAPHEAPGLNLRSGIQSALNAQGPHAEAVATLTWVMVVGGALVFVLVMAFAAYALWGPRRGGWLGSTRCVIALGFIFPLVTLSALLVYTFAVARSIVSEAGPPDLRIEVVGEQWWWRVHYLDSSGRIDFATANELVIPAGKSVELTLKAADVIHSFWVPSLAGKLDMIPGHTNRLRIAASKEGVFRGQCAEYCGGPHAQMGLYVIARNAEDFEAWRVTQRQPRKDVSDETLGRGRTLFLASCASCHSVRGTRAQGTLGPDLTHVGSRTSIGAGILPNNEGTLASWIAASQHLKPGNLMPSMNIYTGDELRAVAAYLAALR